MRQLGRQRGIESGAVPAARHSVAAGLIVAASLFSGSGWAQTGAWPGVVAAAKQEGRVMLYSVQTPPLLARIVAGFQKAYPDIVIEAVRAGSGEQMPKLDLERTAGVDGADVWISGELLWFQARNREGKLLKPAGPATKEWPSRYLVDGVIAVVSVEPFVIVYNKSLIATPPKSYADLLKPELKGRVGTTTLAGTVLLAWYEWLEKTQGGDFWAKLRAQNPKMYPGTVAAAQAVASGELAVYAIGTLNSVKPLMASGAPIDYVLPNPGMGNQYNIAALGWSKRPNAALVLVDFIMSREGQAIWHGQGESASPLPGIPGSLQVSTITTWSPSDYPPEVVAKSRERWSKIFQ